MNQVKYSFLFIQSTPRHTQQSSHENLKRLTSLRFHLFFNLLSIFLCFFGDSSREEEKRGRDDDNNKKLHEME
jgi:hypothetical protein